MDTPLQEQIEQFLIAANEISAEHWKRQNFTHSPPPTVRAEPSSKWVKIIRVENQHDGTSSSGGVYAFICVQDNTTKTLGALKRGDIHKAASYKAPAKHARGNIFNPNFKNCLTPYGIVYLQ